MSKLNVKNSQTKVMPESIDASLDEGRRINFERCSKQPEVDKCHCKSERGQFPKNFFVCKVLFPDEKTQKYPECNHANDFTPNRDMWTHKQYLEYLASPKKRSKPQKFKFIRKNIPPATVYVNKLAQPRQKVLSETFRAHSHHLPIFKVETLMKRIYEHEFQTYQQVMNEMKEKLREKERRVNKQKHEITKMQRKIQKCNEFDSLAETLEKTFRQIMIKDHSIIVSDESKKLSQFVHKKLSQIVKGPRDDNVVDKVLEEFSDKFAWCMSDVFKRYAEEQEEEEEDESDCIDQLKKLCVPIDDYHPLELTEEQGSSEDDDDDNEDDGDNRNEKELRFESEASIKEMIKDDLSFLRLSQIHITPEECQRVAENLRRVEAAISAGTMKRSASAKSLKTAPSLQNAGLGGITIKKKKPKKKKKKGKKINLKCLGNLNPKPQWAVEWTARAEKAENENEN